MKKIFLSAVIAAGSLLATAQPHTSVVPVSGNCGMCGATIEKAAKQGGATTAKWDKTSKMLTVNYDAATTDLLKIENAVAATGYDTKDVKADNVAYNKLHDCCKYDRTKKYNGKMAKGGDMPDCCKNNKDCRQDEKAGADCKKENGKDCCEKK